MKQSIGFLLGLAALSLTAQAIERPLQMDEETQRKTRVERPKEPNAPQQAQAAPPAQGAPQAGPIDFDKLPRKKIIPNIDPQKAWLGIGGEPVAGAFAAQLGIDHGIALVAISPESPAEQAGLQIHDVLLNVDGKSVSNQRDLRSVIESKKPGDEVRVDILRKGEKQTKSVKLSVQKPTEIDVPQNGNVPGGLRGFLDQGDAKQAMEEMEKQMEQFDDQFFGEATDAHDRIRQMIDNMPKGAFKSSFSSNSTFKLMDSEGSVEVQNSNEKRAVTVKDNDGKVLYSGPYETEEDKKAMPEDVRRRVEAFDFQSSDDKGAQNFLNDFFGQ